MFSEQFRRGEKTDNKTNLKYYLACGNNFISCD